MPVIAKIEKHEALAELDNIIAAADGIMVARGDLGIEVPIETVPIIQKQIIAKCNRASKPVVTATQMLESMISSPRPTRAEATDVANAILDGTDAVMLSAETALGAYPTEAVRTMAEIAREVEQHYPHASLRDRRLENFEPTIASSIAEAATRASAELKIPFIVTGTTTGNTAHHIAAFRPQARIVALTPERYVARRLALLWGTESLLIDSYSSIDVLLYMTERHMVHEGLGSLRRSHRVHDRHAGRLGWHQRAQDPPDSLSVSREQRASVAQGRVVRFAGEHARDLGFAFLRADDRPNRNRRLPLTLGLLQNVVPIGPRRKLREMRYADDLSAARQLADARADRGRGGAADTGIDFVEDQRRRRVARAGEHDDECEQHARELAARCDARKRTRRLAGIRREEKFDALGAVRADALERLDCDLEPSRRKRDLGKLATMRFDSALAARARNALNCGRRLAQLAFGGGRFGFELRDVTIAAFVLVDELLGAFGGRRNFVDRRAILTLQSLDQFEPRVDRFELRGIVLRRFQRTRKLG